MRFHQMKERFEILMKLADKVYGASENLCDEYEKIFDRKILPLYKGCDLSLPIKNKPNKPLRIVYAGNLLYGRAETLSRLSEAIRLVNADEEKAALEIYTGTTFSPQIALLLKTGPGTDIYSARPYEEIKSIMNDADVVLHVESFEDEQIANVRLSFSTKIIDCLQSGSGILAIGPARIASIEYLRKIDGVHVVDNPDDILARLQQIVDQPVQLIKQAIKIREFALEHHDIKTVHERLRADFSALLGECDL